MQELGRNVLVQWRPDSAMIVVGTEFGHLIIYHLVVPTDVKTLYELVDPPTPSLRRESDELFVKELIPPLIFSLASPQSTLYQKKTQGFFYNQLLSFAGIRS